MIYNTSVATAETCPHLDAWTGDIDVFATIEASPLPYPREGGVTKTPGKPQDEDIKPDELLWALLTDATVAPHPLQESEGTRPRRNCMVEAAKFLADLYHLSSRNRINDAIDSVIERFEHWLENSDWIT